MRKVALTLAAMILGTGVAAAAGNGNYNLDLAAGTWGNNIQATHQVATPSAQVNNGNYNLDLAAGTWYSPSTQGNVQVASRDSEQ